MKVKIGGIIYSSEDEPIMIILSEKQKELIANMGDCLKFCSYPDDDKYTIEMIKEFMETTETVEE